MSQAVYGVRRERFDLLDKNCYLMEGNWPKDFELDARLDQQMISGEIEKLEKVSALERFADLDGESGIQACVKVHLPEELETFHRLVVYAVRGADRRKWFEIPVKKLKTRIGRPEFYIEEEVLQKEKRICQIRGWAVAAEPVTIEVQDAKGKALPYTIEKCKRHDVAEMIRETEIDAECGFFIEIKNVDTKVIYLVLKTPSAKAVWQVDQRSYMVWKHKVSRYAKKGVFYLRKHGWKELLEKTNRKVQAARREPQKYPQWIRMHLPDQRELATQRRTVFTNSPRFSIVVPLYRTPENYLRQMVDSVRNQTYPNWELCLSDGSGEHSPIEQALRQMENEDKRIRVVRQEKQLQISENTNAAIAAATGDFVVFMDHDDVLTPNALFECAKILNTQPELDVIYSDEDKMTMDGNQFFQPHFKPDFNPDLLCSMNYICHLFVVRRSYAQEKVGWLRSEYDGAQDYDFILRCVENTDRIHHIPKILYHWRSHEDSTAENPESKRYAFDAGRRAVQAHYDRIGIAAEALDGEYLGLYRTRYHMDTEPLISIIIPNKDHIDDLKRCIDSIEKHSTYRNYEYIIVENNSTEQETFAYYEQLEALNPKVHVVYYKDKFNYSKINNFGVQFARGDLFLLLNNDTKIINEDCLYELAGYCTRSDVGIVGARLYYEDDTIQHAGVVIGFGGIAGHCFVQQPRGTTGYCHRIICAQDYSAVTAACMMVRREVYEKVGGFTEELAVAFNDVDFCLKVRREGYLVVYNPYAELYHFESKSRGLEDTPEKVERFHGEIRTFERRWPEILMNGDPYYNPNLTLESQDFSRKRL